MSMYNFGTGKLVAVPTHLADGTPIAAPTPVIFGEMDDVSVDLSVEIKQLHGGRRYALAAGQGKGKSDLKAKYAKIDGAALGSLYFGKSASAGIKAAVFDSPAVIPATSPYTLTVTPPNTGAFVSDLGVVFTSLVIGGEQQLTRVEATPAAGQYTVSPLGVYTFAAADKEKGVSISYEYSAATGGQVWNLKNEVMGYTPSFSVLLQNSYDGKSLVLKLNRCVSGKLAFAFKADDFGVNDFEATAYADATNSLGYICLF